MKNRKDVAIEFFGTGVPPDWSFKNWGGKKLVLPSEEKRIMSEEVMGIVLKVPSRDVVACATRKMNKLEPRLARLQALHAKAKELDKSAQAENANTEDEDGPVAVTMSHKALSLQQAVVVMQRDLEMLRLIVKYGELREHFWLEEHQLKELGFMVEDK